MTVSNVVNGRYDMMSYATRQRIEAAIRDLSYRPHSAGRRLRMDERLKAGILIVDESPSFLADPFTTHLVAGLSTFLSEQGFGLLVQGTTATKMRKSLFLRQFDTDGLCVLLSGTEGECDHQLEQLAVLGQPLITFEYRPKNAKEDVCAIRQDNHGGAYSLAQHVLGLGARRCLLLVPTLEWSAVRERQRGIEDALREVSGAELRIVSSGEAFDDTRYAFEEVLREYGHPDVVMGANDQMAIAAMRLLLEQGIRVPEDVMVTGFNAFEFRPYTAPILTSVVSRAYEMGIRGGQELLTRISSGAFSSTDIVVGTELAVGESTR